MKILTFCGVIIIVLLGVTFAVLNADQVEINYIVGEKSLPVSLLIVMTLIFGGILGVIASLPMIFRTKHEIKRLKRNIKLNEQELKNLRTFPLQDEH